MLTQLTPAQTAAMPAHRDKWIARMLATGPADRPSVEAGIRGMYRAANMPEPKRIVWTDNPLVAALAAPIAAVVIAYLQGQIPRAKDSAVDSAVRSAVGSAVDSAVDRAVGSAVDSAVDSAVRSAVGSAVDSAVRSAVDSAVRSAVKEAIYNGYAWRFAPPWWAGWLAWRTFFRDAAGIALPPCLGDAEQAMSAGYWWPYPDFAIVSDRWQALHRDEQGRPHCETGPAVAWGMWALWFWHGVQVSQQVIESPATLTVEQIKREDNAEVRRIMRERFGEGRYLVETKARVIDADGGNPRAKGAAPRVLLEDDRGDRVLVGTDGSTRRVYHMPVPRTAATCRAAHEAISGLPEAKCLAES